VGPRPATINGPPGAGWAPGGKPNVVFDFTLLNGKVVEIDLIADPVELSQLNLVF
jgi:RNA polymerase sigma-70 factor (ECF subfamily)